MHPPMLQAGRRARWLSFLPLAALTLCACGDEAAKVAPAASASAGPTGPILDGKLGEAANELAKSQGKPAASVKPNAEGPPPNNMFTPEGAERAHPRTASPKVELMGDGNEPRLQLGASRPEGTQDMLLIVAISSGQQQALPPVALRLKIFEKGKGEPAKPGAKPGAKPKAAEPLPEGASPPTEIPVVAEVIEGAVAGMPPGSVPKQLSEAIGKLKGSTITWTQTKSGPRSLAYALSKDADEGLGLALEAAADVLGGALLPVPEKAVGEGATWMVTDRSSTMGLDAVRYRFAKIEKVDGDRATLSVQVRRYAASDQLNLPLGPQMSTASLDKIDSQGNATLVIVPKAWVPDSAEIGSKLMASLVPPGGKNPGVPPGQRLQVQLEVVGQMRSPAALAAAAKDAPTEGPGRGRAPRPAGP